MATPPDKKYTNIMVALTDPRPNVNLEWSNDNGHEIVWLCIQGQRWLNWGEYQQFKQDVMLFIQRVDDIGEHHE